MEEEHQRRGRRQRDEAAAETDAHQHIQAETHKGRHPMGRVRDWMADFGFLGAMTGLAAALTHVVGSGLALGETWPLLAVTPILLGVAATLAGAVAGGMLRALRGKVSPLLGVLAAGAGVNAVGSAITVSLPWDQLVSTSLIAGKAMPLSLAVWLLIPLLAVLRWREESTLPWLMAAGALAGVMIGWS